jgi:alpha-1,2-mannosyltransferase
MPAVALVLVVVGAAVDAWSAAHYSYALYNSPDFRDFMSGGARFVAGSNLYEGSGAFHGFVGPPFQALVFAPLSAIFASHPNVALALWVAITFAALVAGVRVWAAAVSIPASSPAALAAVAIAAFPIYREFQTQNMNALLLLCAGLSVRALQKATSTSTSHDAEAGAWIALATALKLYPGLPLAYFALRGRWRIVLAGGAALAGLSLLPVLRFGVGRFIWLCREWLRTREVSTWPPDFQSQSLTHLVNILWPGPHAARTAAATLLVLVAGAMAIGWLRRRRPLQAPEELAFVTLVGFIASPIGWISYWILAIPSLLILSRDAPRRMSSRVVLMISAFLGLIIGPAVRDHPRGEFLVMAIVLIAVFAARLIGAAEKPAAPTVV